MSNFNAFSEQHLVRLLDPFVPGKSQSITPIKYEAITPDIFAFAFRTTGKDLSHHFFVSLEYDYLKDIAAAGRLIENWMQTDIINFWRPDEAPERDSSQSLTLDDVRAESEKPYYCLLAQIKRPGGNGYWARYITLNPGDTIANKIERLPEKQQAAILKSLERILKHPLDNRLHDTDKPMTIYAHDDGETEFFIGA